MNALPVGHFRCPRCAQAFPMSHGNATAQGLVCRTCIDTMTPSGSDPIDTMTAVVESRHWRRAFLVLLLTGATIAFGWRFWLWMLRVAL